MTTATNERRPAPASADLQGSRSATKRNKSRNQRTATPTASPSNSTVAPARLGWAAALIDSADGLIPQYGSPEWLALPDDSRAKVAATVVAAEAWRTYWLPEEHARRLRVELDAAREYEDPAQWSPEIVAEVHRTASRPSYADLCELRGEPEKATRARQRHLQAVADD